MRKLIKNVNVFDGKNRELLEHHYIIIEDNLVAEISTGEISEDNFDEVIDGRNQYAVPGLTDTHVHLGRITDYQGHTNLEYSLVLTPRITAKLLAHGITTVRDAGGITVGLKQAIDEGLVDGPRIYPSNAYISQTCGHGDNDERKRNRDIQYRIPSSGVLADGVPEVLRAVREQFYRGASQIKIMAGGGMSSEHDPVATVQFTYEEMKAIVDATADYGTYVMAHLYTPECMKRAIKAGVKSLEHAHAMDDETARMIQAEDVFVTPMPQFTEEEIKWNHMGPYADYVSYKKKKPGANDVKAKTAYATELINKYDLKILFGTDMMVTYPDYEPRQGLDFKEYKKRFGSYKGIVSATGNVNDLIKLTTYQNPYPEGEIGILKKGSFADILVIQGNPVEDMDLLYDVNNIQLIMKDGKVYKNTLS